MRDINRSILVFVGCFITILLITQSYVWNVVSLDEGTYLSIGMLMSKGWIVYRDVFESKPPLFHFINYLIYLMVGNRLHAARLFAILAGASTAYVLYEIVKKTYDENIGIISALFFSFFASLPVFDGFKILTEPFSTLLQVLLIYIYFKYTDGRETNWLILLGLLTSSYILIRPTGVFFFGVLMSLAVVRWKTIRFVSLKYVALGGVIPILIIGSYFLFHSSLSDLIFWVFEPVRGFQSYVVTSWMAKLRWIKEVVFSTLSLISLLLLSRDKENQALFELNIIWVVFLPFLFICTFLPGFPHYYYELLPALSIQAAVGAGFIIRKKLSKNTLALVLLVLVASFFVSLAHNRGAFYEYRGATDFPLSLKISYDVREHSWPEESILVFETAWPKLGPSIYYLSERAPPFQNLFFFPWSINEVEFNRIYSSIDRLDPSVVVLIGPSPSIPEVVLIYEKVEQEYALIDEYSDSTGIYPHIEQDTIYVKIYKRPIN